MEDDVIRPILHDWREFSPLEEWDAETKIEHVMKTGVDIDSPTILLAHGCGKGGQQEDTHELFGPLQSIRVELICIATPPLYFPFINQL